MIRYADGSVSRFCGVVLESRGVGPGGACLGPMTYKLARVVRGAFYDLFVNFARYRSVHSSGLVHKFCCFGYPIALTGAHCVSPGLRFASQRRVSLRNEDAAQSGCWFWWTDASGDVNGPGASPIFARDCTDGLI